MKLFNLINWFMNTELQKYRIQENSIFRFAYLQPDGLALRCAKGMTTDNEFKAEGNRDISVLFIDRHSDLEFDAIDTTKVFGTADQMVIPVFFDETGANGSLSCVLQLHFSQVIGRPGNEKLMPQMVTMNQLSENEQSLLGMLTLSESGVKPCTLFWPEGFVPTELVFELRIVISGHNLSCPIKVKYSLAELSDQYEPIYYDILLSSRENELSLKPVCNAIGRDGWRRTIELGASESTVLFEEVVCE